MVVDLLNFLKLDVCIVSTRLLLRQAINIFTEARPPGIYKPDYIDALYRFYHEMKPDNVVCPPTPEWKRSSDLDLNGDAMPDDDDDDDGDPSVPPEVCVCVWCVHVYNYLLYENQR